MTKHIIKRYPNRKLYNTNTSCYITLKEISELIKQCDTIQVIDNKTKQDITQYTLMQVYHNSMNPSDYTYDKLVNMIESV